MKKYRPGRLIGCGDDRVHGLAADVLHLAEIARRIDAGELTDFGEQFTAVKSVLEGRTVRVSPQDFDAAIAGTRRVATSVKLRHVIGYVENELGLIPPDPLPTKLGHSISTGTSPYREGDVVTQLDGGKSWTLKDGEWREAGPDGTKREN